MDNDIQVLKKISKSLLVVDFDFSLWNEQIRLVVVEAIDFEFNEQSNIYNIDFIKPRKCFFEAPTHPNPSPAWEIQNGCKIEEHDDLLIFDFEGLGPKLHLECLSLKIEYVFNPELRIIDNQWFKARHGLIRPSLYKIVNLLKMH